MNRTEEFGRRMANSMVLRNLFASLRVLAAHEWSLRAGPAVKKQAK